MLKKNMNKNGYLMINAKIQQVEGKTNQLN